MPTVIFPSDQHAVPAEISVEVTDGNRAQIRLEGEIDAAFAPELQAELDRHRAARRRVMRVDLQYVTFMDSTALQVLVDAHRQWLQMRGTLVLTGVCDPTLRLLQLTELDRELFCMPISAEALLLERNAALVT